MFFSQSCAHKNMSAKVEKNLCSDFLKDLNIKNDKLILKECIEGKGFGTDLPAHTARYTIAGSEAKNLEKQLMSQYDMKPLSFACCGWEARPQNVTINNLYYTVWMSSEETLEKDWNKIDKFNLSIEKMWDLP